MYDSCGRKIEYIRISVTDRCNLRCKYCMPEGIECIPMSEILTFEEITEICSVAAELGIRHIRLTGGEPLVRKHIEGLIGMLKRIDGIESVMLTTNGVLLSERLEALINSGLDGVNISLDTLSREKYAAITGFDAFDRVLEAIYIAENRGLNTKINTVVLENNVDECVDIAELAKDKDIAVRFIEMMPIGNGCNFKAISCNEVYKQLMKKYKNIEPAKIKGGFGPAEYYRIEGFKGSIGFINAVHKKFCSQCNRIRLTSTGYLKSCLCYDTGTELKKIIREQGKDELKAALYEAIYNKPEEHCFNNTEAISEKNIMSEIGG